MIDALYSFFAGLLTFFSPCVFPLLPSYLVFIGAISLDDRSSEFIKGKKSIYHTLAFIAGFSFVFVSLGLAGSAIGNFLLAYKEYLILTGGLILVIFGFYTLGLLKVPFLSRYLVLDMKHKPHGILGSFAVGITFTLGWTPCLGPAVSSVLILAMTSGSTLKAVFFLALYSLGLGIPFFISSFILERLLAYFSRLAKFTRYSRFILGVLILTIGATLLLGIYRPFIPRP
ncbi:MAG: cytochrome c biogenesis protein CcdA [Desulfobacterota bacterium]|nr:cytochrome c biogenesis protein CcdA [Thermodesulfobacteriota bacterium]